MISVVGEVPSTLTFEWLPMKRVEIIQPAKELKWRDLITPCMVCPTLKLVK